MRFRPWIWAWVALAILLGQVQHTQGQDPPPAVDTAEAPASQAAESESPAAESPAAPPAEATAPESASTETAPRPQNNGVQGNSVPPKPKSEEEQAELAPGDLASPRATMRTLLRSINQKEYAKAAMTLDFSGIDPPPNAQVREELAFRLKEIIDRLAYVNYDALPDNSEKSEFEFAPGPAEYSLTLAEGRNGQWRFSAATVAKIDSMYDSIKDEPIVQAPWYRRLHIGDNELWHIGALFLSIILAWIVGRILRTVLNRIGGQMSKRQPLMGSAFTALARAAVPAALVGGLQIGLSFLVLNDTVRGISDVIVSVLWTLAVSFAVWCLVDVVETWLSNLAKHTHSTMNSMLVPMVRTTLKATVVIMALVQVATILSDKPITSVIAGLGIGGLAIGLAAQDMVKNFFGSIMIFSDRPFEMGDRIQVEGFDGTIEAVGFRSTRLRTLDGHLVTIPNGSLANASVRNVSKRPNIRRILNLGLTYDTPPEKVRRAKAIVEELLADHEGMHPDLPPRVYFTEFNDSALNLNVIYWYHPPEWWDYNAFSENLNMEILTRFNAEGLDFAFPSQTVYLAGGGGDTKTEEPSG